MVNPDRPKFEKEPEKIKGGIWMTRADHLRISSSPPIDSKFGDNVCKGDTLTDKELADFYAEELKGIRSILSLPEEQRKILRDGSSFLDPNYLSSELDYYRGRGMDVADGETLLEDLKHLE